MAKIGLRKPYYALYANNNGTVTYSDGAILARAVDAQLELEDTEAVKLYADDAVAESVAGFSTGKLTLTVDELSVAKAAAILGMTTESSSSPAGTILKFTSTQATPNLGLGFIVTKVVNNVNKYVAMILPKIQFEVPAGDYTTQGETVEFQTQELTATVMRDDTSSGTWKIEGEFASPADAEAYIKDYLSIS